MEVDAVVAVAEVEYVGIFGPEFPKMRFGIRDRGPIVKLGMK